MDYFVKQKTGSRELGTAAEPFSTIQQAAELAKPGDTVWIGEGVYREWVRPRRGGLDEDHRIVYRNLPGERATVSGAEPVSDWTACGGNVWKATLPNAVLAGYNPYADEIFGDWYNSFGQTHHTGEIFLDGQALYEAPDLDHIRQPADRRNWFAEVSDRETTVWIYLPQGDPSGYLMEASVRPYCFFPEQEGLGYITVSGLTLENAATQWAPPTAFQPGIIGPNWSKGWIIENCMVRNYKCAGISLGKRREAGDNIWSYDPTKSGTQTYTELVFENLKRDWSGEHVGSHIVRNNEIYGCGQAGIVGCMGGAFSVISGNHIHDVKNRLEFGGWEMAGIKLHAGIDVQIEDNLIHHCNRAVWLDWQAQGARVARNAFFANREDDMLIEVCHGPCTVDHNLFLSECSLLNMSQGVAYVHNLFAGEVKLFQEPNRFTMYHFPHDTFVHGLMVIYGGDDRVIGNLYLGSGTGTAGYNGYPDQNSKQDTPENGMPASFANNPLPVRIRDNLYLGGAKPYEQETGAVEAAGFQTSVRTVLEDGQWFLETNLPDYAFDPCLPLVTTETLGQAFQAEAAYENPDGTPFTLSLDFTGTTRGDKNIPGPLTSPMRKIPLNPKSKGAERYDTERTGT